MLRGGRSDEINFLLSPRPLKFLGITESKNQPGCILPAPVETGHNCCYEIFSKSAVSLAVTDVRQRNGQKGENRPTYPDNIWFTVPSMAPPHKAAVFSDFSVY